MIIIFFNFGFFAQFKILGTLYLGTLFLERIKQQKWNERKNVFVGRVLLSRRMRLENIGFCRKIQIT